MKKVLCVAAVILVLVMALMGTTQAAEAPANGLLVSIETDKANYQKDEPISAKIVIKNTNYFSVLGVSMSAVIPQGYTIAEGAQDHDSWDLLAPGETKTLSVVLESMEKSNMKGIYILVIATAAVILLSSIVLIIVFCRKGHKKQVVAMVLCIALLASVFTPTIAKVTQSYEAFQHKQTVDVGGSAVALAASVQYISGLSENFKEFFGLDDSDGDYDDDGIADHIEILLLGSDPKVADADLDADLDGLTNGTELLEYKTNPVVVDTDMDGLTDYQEIDVYHTNPLVNDTDNDGIPDGYEVTLLCDPLEKDKLGEIKQVAASDVIDEALLADNDAVPGLEAKCEYVLSDIAHLTESEIQSISDIRAVLGKGVDLQLDQNVDMTLSFDVSDVSKPLTIMKWEEEQGWSFLDTEKDEEKVYANVSESGTYCVANLDILLPLLGIDANSYYRDLVIKMPAPVKAASRAEKGGGAQVMGQADIVFVIDTTGSMSDEISNVAENIEVFVQRLTTEYNVNVNFSLIDYRDILADGEDSTKVVVNGNSNWYADTALYANTIHNLWVSGGGDTPESTIDALEEARRLDFRATATKFIIVVTDADYKVANRFGIESMDDEIALLQEQGVVTSVVTTSSYQSVYEALYTSTGGLYANIYGDFASELLKLADLIGTQTSEGNWILLDDFTHVSLENPLAPGSGDTDGDGISDYDELKSPRKLPMIGIVMDYLERKGISREMIEEYFASKDDIFVEIYPYKSNPVLVDTDFDGIGDKIDTKPKVATQSGQMKGSKYLCNLSYRFDYRDFFQHNQSFNRNLSEISLLFSNVIYDGGSFAYSDTVKYANPDKDSSITYLTTKKAADITTLLNVHGFEDVDDFSLDTKYSDDDLSQVALAHHTVEYLGRTRQVVAVIIRGTNATVEEWSSNFDIGDPANQDWENGDNHRGFDVTAKRIMERLNAYVQANVTERDVVFWVTGHSRGAAIANIVAADLVDEGKNVYAYTFATPNTTTAADADATRYDCIFNVVNGMDFVARLPLAKWKFCRYGRSAAIYVTPLMRIEMGSINPTFSYNEMGMLNMINLISSFESVANSRSECYAYSCSCHGGGSDTDIIEDLGSSYSISERAARYCKIVPYKDGEKTCYTSCQVPAFFMQVLAEVMSTEGTVKKGEVLLSYRLAGRYQWKRLDLVAAVIGGMESPHYTETYYILNRHATNASFR